MTQRFRGVVWAAVAFVAAGCAGPVRQKLPPIFYPPAPDLPRIQYLTSFSSMKDIEEQSAFNRFVLGEKPDVTVDKPYGLAVSDGKVYVCDTNATVVVFDYVAKRFGPLAGAVGEGKLVQPINISVDAQGTKYVADPVRGQIVAFDRNDAFMRAYGQVGSWRPVDVVPLEDRLYVADPANGMVKVFDQQSGQLIKSFGDKGDPSERLDRPTNLAFDRDGYLYVTDVGRFQVVKFDRDGHFKGTIGRPGDNVGHFARPKGLSVDRDGRLYVVDASFNNVQVFNKDGRLLMFFGQGGEKPGDLTLPAKVLVDYDSVKYFEQFVDPSFEPEYLVFVTSQFGPRRVNVLAYGQQKGKTYPSDADLLKLMDERRRQEREKTKP